MGSQRICDCISHLVHVVQYYELAFKFYEHYYQLAGTLLYLTIQSSFLASYALYQKRIHLFKSVGQKRLVPIVQSGHIRYLSLFLVSLLPLVCAMYTMLKVEAV